MSKPLKNGETKFTFAMIVKSHARVILPPLLKGKIPLDKAG
jgi:hypothetical protein